MLLREDSERSAELSAAKLYIVFSRAYRSVDAYIQARIAARGIYLSDFGVLEALVHKGPLTAKAVAQKIHMSEISVTPSVRRLETLGYVRHRSVRGENGNSKTIELTPPGKKLIREIYRRHAGDIERVMHPLSSAERLELYRVAKKLGLHSEGLQLARFSDRPGSLSPSQLRRATTYLARYSGVASSVAEIAAKLGLSASQFSRAFKASTSLPPYQWQLNFRIAKAQELLQYGGLPLAQIALATGFTEQSHFTRIFKKIVGVSPGAWQRDHG